MRIAALYGMVKAKGKKLFIHCCSVDELSPDLIEIGVDVFNLFQPGVMDVKELKFRCGCEIPSSEASVRRRRSRTGPRLS